jgi:hypothetical protein
MFVQKLGRYTRRGNAGACRDVIARSESDEASILSLCGEMDCFASLAMTVLGLLSLFEN